MGKSDNEVPYRHTVECDSTGNPNQGPHSKDRNFVLAFLEHIRINGQYHSSDFSSASEPSAAGSSGEQNVPFRDYYQIPLHQGRDLGGLLPGIDAINFPVNKGAFIMNQDPNSQQWLIQAWVSVKEPAGSASGSSASGISEEQNDPFRNYYQIRLHQGKDFGSQLPGIDAIIFPLNEGAFNKYQDPNSQQILIQAWVSVKEPAGSQVDASSVLGGAGHGMVPLGATVNLENLSSGSSAPGSSGEQNFHFPSYNNQIPLHQGRDISQLPGIGGLIIPLNEGHFIMHQNPITQQILIQALAIAQEPAGAQDGGAGREEVPMGAPVNLESSASGSSASGTSGEQNFTLCSYFQIPLQQDRDIGSQHPGIGGIIFPLNEGHLIMHQDPITQQRLIQALAIAQGPAGDQAGGHAFDRNVFHYDQEVVNEFGEINGEHAHDMKADSNTEQERMSVDEVDNIPQVANEFGEINGEHAHDMEADSNTEQERMSEEDNILQAQNMYNDNNRFYDDQEIYNEFEDDRGYDGDAEGSE